VVKKPISDALGFNVIAENTNHTFIICTNTLVYE